MSLSQKEMVFGKEIEQAIYDIVRAIPPKRVTSYGAIAKAIGYPNMSRMVGRIMGQCNSTETGVPAHRVVNSNGILSGKDAFGTTGEMQRLLESEGIVVVNNKIKDLKTVFWEPLKEIRL